MQGAMMVYDLAMESPLAAVLASIAPVAGAPMLGFLRDVSQLLRGASCSFKTAADETWSIDRLYRGT